MPKCKRCGKDAFPNRFVCSSCLNKFTEKRKLAFEIVQNELGKLCKENHSQFVKRLKQVEKAI